MILPSGKPVTRLSVPAQKALAVFTDMEFHPLTTLEVAVGRGWEIAIEELEGEGLSFSRKTKNCHAGDLMHMKLKAKDKETIPESEYQEQRMFKDA